LAARRAIWPNSQSNATGNERRNPGMCRPVPNRLAECPGAGVWRP
jgi:hypothetical protein